VSADQGEQALVFFGAGGAAGEMGEYGNAGVVGRLLGEIVEIRLAQARELSAAA